MSNPIFPQTQNQLGNAQAHDGTGFCPKCQKSVRYRFLVLDDKINTQATGWVCSECNLTLMAVEKERFTRKIVRRYLDPGLEAYTLAKFHGHLRETEDGGELTYTKEGAIHG